MVNYANYQKIERNENELIQKNNERSNELHPIC